MGKSLFSRSSEVSNSKGFNPFIIGRVKKVVLGPENYDGSKNDDYSNPSDVGKIFYEVMYSNMNLSKAKYTGEPAFPIFSFIKQYPLVSEIVMIIPGPDSNLNDSISSQGYYYFPPYNLWNSLNHNAFPNMEEYAEYVKEFYTKNQYSGNNPNNDSMPKLPLGYTFSELDNLKQLRIFEGDSIIESRFGQSIRFGSTVNGSSNLNDWSSEGPAGAPITIIRNGQGKIVDPDNFKTITENINRDNASIWLTSGQKIQIDNLDRFPKKSFDRYKTLIAERTQTATSNTTTSKLSKSAAAQDNQSMA
jgi:hypothetical protein